MCARGYYITMVYSYNADNSANNSVTWLTKREPGDSLGLEIKIFFYVTSRCMDIWNRSLVLRRCMVPYGTAWYYMVVHGTLWYCMV